MDCSLAILAIVACWLTISSVAPDAEKGMSRRLSNKKKMEKEIVNIELVGRGLKALLAEEQILVKGGTKSELEPVDSGCACCICAVAAGGAGSFTARCH